jgi:hypothetical protein
MKKLNFILGLVLVAVATLCSCKDETGDFVEQLYTNSQKETAIKACLRASADSAFRHLCVADGFYSYKDSAYCIDYIELQNSLFDTLSNHGYGNLADTLILFTNRMAESCGAQLSPSFKTAIEELEIIDYDRLLNGDDGSITEYFRLYKSDYLKSAFQSPVAIRMALYRVNETWNEMMRIYVQYSTIPLNFDIQNYLINSMLNSFIQEMRVEESLVRHDSTHRDTYMLPFE